MTVLAPPLPASAAVPAALSTLAGRPELVHIEHLPSRPARFAPLARPLEPELRQRLPIEGFWSHQAAAIDLARDGRSVAVATGTASGKSLCFQVPLAEAVGCRPGGTALALYPTKALAHDQLRALTELDLPGVVAGAYDGDSSTDERAWVRANANVVLTNPEMLHHGILPRHARWSTLLSRLRYVVVDELHVLRGVFGTNVAHLLRRLRRVCAHYGADPTFLFSSATIGEPARLASELCGLEVTAVTDDGSPRGDRWFALVNPTLAPAEEGRSANQHTAALLASFVAQGRRTIAFCRSRKGTELVAAEARRHLPHDLARTVRPYRGGYLPSERREIELELFAGRLRGVVTTTALELGVDVGGLDGCVLDGFPGTVASMWQQAGRAGRQADGEDAVVVLVAGEDQLDQWLVTRPHELFGRPPEPAVINPTNPFVFLPHLACAAYERPLSRDDDRFWPGLLDDGVRQLVLDDQLKLRPRDDHPVAVWAGDGWPADRVGLRSGGGAEFRIARSDGTLVGTVDGGRAFSLVHPGAIYLHQGQTYRVTDLDLDDRAALVEVDDGDEYTQPRSDTTVRVLAESRRRAVGSARLSLGDVEVVTQVTGYKRREVATGDLLGSEDLHLPPTTLVTRAFWYTIPDEVLDEAGRILQRGIGAGADELDRPGALHAAEHALIGLLPLFTICDRWDVGGVSTAWHSDVGGAAIFVYDGYPGGAGVAELGFDAGDRHVAATSDLIAACPCEDGCPSCVQSPKCGNGNEPLHKVGALALLQVLTTSAANG